MSQLSNDNPSREDSLGRKKFAEQIIRSLTSYFEKVDESIVVGICGKWGSGKTTLLTFVEEALQKHYENEGNNFRVIHFNPWASTGIEELQRNLLETIIKELETIKWKEGVKKANDTFKKYLQYLNYLKFLKNVHPVAKNIFESVDEYSKKVSAISLDDLKKKINSLIKNEEIKLYIIVDDLDRLDPEEIISIFKTIKLNINFLNTCYLVAYDKDVVINALKNLYNNNAADYLEKIIQVDFTIPAILEEQIEENFFEKLNDCFSKLNLKYDERDIFRIWKHQGLREYFLTLRDIKRYINSLLLSLPNIGEEINIGDFITLEAIKVFDFPGYEKLYQKILEIRRKARWASVSFDNETISKFENQTTQSLLSYLFLNNNTLYPLGDSINKKKLSDPEFYERYFSLHIPKSDITESSLSDFLAPESNKFAVLNEIQLHGRMKNFLRRLSDRDLRKYYQINDLKLFHGFLQFWDQQEKYITSEIDEYLWNGYFNLAHSMEDKHKAAREAVVSLIMNESEYQPMKLVFNHFILLFKEEGRSDRQLQGDIKDQIDIILPELKEKFQKNMLHMWSSYFYKISMGENCWPCNLFIYSFAKYCSGEYIREVGKYLENANFIAFLVKNNFILQDSETNRPSMIKLDHKNILFPENLFDKFIQQIKNRKKGALNDKDEEVVAFFLKEYEKG